MEEKTNFAPANRSSSEDIQKEFKLVDTQKYFSEIFGEMTGIGAVIDSNRQIVYTNNDFLVKMGLSSIEAILGKRLGEVVSCIHSTEQISGCGTSEACAFCGAVNAMLESQKIGSRVMRETRISSEIGGKVKSWDFNITSTPIKLSGNQFYVLVLQDISNEKRRFALERIFFHDLLNTAGSLNGILSMLKDGTNPGETRELIDLSEEASRIIIEEITEYRQLIAAENGDLQINLDKLNTLEILKSVVDNIRYTDIAKGRNLNIDKNADNDIFDCDKTLLKRILTNLLKNALEATPVDGTVNAGCKISDERITFWVQNSGIMSKEIQMQIFQRSFSTKGTGRGIGTYGVRLLTENYLKGKISFVSNEYEGTIFTIELNKYFQSDN